VQRLLPILLLLASCSAAPEAPAAAPESAPPRATHDRVIDRAADALKAGDVAGARAGLEKNRWLADDRARAALLLFGCLLVDGRHGEAVEILRGYLAKTPRIKTERDVIVVRLLRHHASGGGLEARNAEEACYFGLYALKALGEKETARADLARARSKAPEPERYLARAVEP